MDIGWPRVIGLLGGMSWESSAEDYRLVNELVRDRLGGLHSARCVLASCVLICTNTMHKVAGAAGDSPVPVYPTTRLHADAAVRWSLGEDVTPPAP